MSKESLFLAIIRTEALRDRTMGKLLVNGQGFCHTLEDTIRPPGIKVKHETAIPAGLYRVKITHSQRFGREMPLVLGVPGFDGIRLHGGNGPENTSGCPLIAYNRSGSKIWGTAEAELTEKIKAAGGECLLVIVDHLEEVP